MLRNIRFIALIFFIEGLVTLIWLSTIPASGVFSPVRSASLLGIVLVSLGGIAVFIFLKSENRFTQNLERLAHSGSGLLVSWLFTTLSLSLWVTILYRSWLVTFIDETAYARLLPIAVFGMLLCLQLGILFLASAVSKDTWENVIGPVWKPTLILLGCFLTVWVLISVTHLGFVFDNVGLSWGPPGTPISFPQINLVFAVSVSLAFAYLILQPRISLSLRARDIFIFAGLWGLAILLWWNTPVSATHFNPPPMAPNNEVYPNSDALIFDRSAHQLLYGIGFSDQLHRRPLYVGMLALFHKLGGSGYDDVIFLQILVLAFIPALTYLLTAKLSNRLAGLIAGGLILLREKNAIELSGKIVTSNAKLMMSDMIALLGVIAFVYVMTKIFERKDNNLWLLGIAGATLGLTALVRAQVLIILPILLLFMFLNRKPLKLGIKDSTVIMLGFVLVMLPWVWRNWNLTGTFVLDDRGEERLLARNYTAQQGNLPEPLPNESPQEFSARLKRDIFTYMIEHPSDVTFFISNHFLRNIATGTVYLAPLLSTDSLHNIIDSSLFWERWQGKLNGNSGLSIFITLMFVAIGISIAQTKNKPAGWFPLAVFLVYSAGNALVRSSGWRFSLPVDWIVLVYYAIALSYLPSLIRFVNTQAGTIKSKTEIRPQNSKSTPLMVVFGLLLLTGAAVPIAEKLIPEQDFSRFTQKAEDNLLSTTNISSTDMETFLTQKDAVFYTGMALYPRYIAPNSRVYLAGTPQGFTFLHFWLIHEGSDQIVLPLQTSSLTLPHTTTVSVLGCKEENYVVAWAIIVHTPTELTLFREPSAPFTCPQSAPN